MIDLELQLAQGAFQLAAQLRSDARVLGLFGPSGAGKSTLLNALVGSLPAVRGKVVIDAVVCWIACGAFASRSMRAAWALSTRRGGCSRTSACATT